ncbi:hypothetical protein [Streptomyces sp. WAC 06783]|uniref:hypothetical protein n=1 Tax=Streptomyces sp. WAC 06783 TaxID=2203211 RepID=UPI000F73FC5D|nr:hypothetical protein [Streptomyces sp. WAC 06783]
MSISSKVLLPRTNPLYRRTARTGPDTDTLAEQILTRESAGPCHTPGAPRGSQIRARHLVVASAGRHRTEPLHPRGALAVTGARPDPAWKAVA